MKTFIALLPVLCFHIVKAREAFIYQPPIEEWYASPSSKSTGKVGTNCGYNGGPCLIITGNKTGSAIMYGPDINSTIIPPGETFLFTALYKCTPTTTTPIMSITNVRCGYASYVPLSTTGYKNGWSETSVFVRIPEKTVKKMYTQLYMEEGTCYFDQFKLTRVDITSAIETQSTAP